MTLSTTINFDNSSNFTFDSSKIEFISSTARLKLQTGNLSFTESYDSDSGFSYDSGKTEFISGQLRQKSQRPANSLFAATFTSTKNASWPSGIAAVDVGTPTLSGGYLICSGGNNGIYYENSLIGNLGSRGSIKFKYRPAYSGTPASNTGILYLGNPVSLSGADQLGLSHFSAGGTLRVTARNAANGSAHLTASIGLPWSPVAGQTYEFELVFDTEVTGIRLYINGVLHGSLPATFTRSTTATRLYIGANPSYGAALADFDDLILFSNAQHSSGYTPGYSISETEYLETSASLPVWTHAGLGVMLGLTTLSESASGARYSLSLGGDPFTYWNGSAWAASSGTFAQANTAAEINTNAASLPLSGKTTAQLKVHFQASNTQSSVSANTFSYVGQTQYPTSDPYVSVNSISNLDDLLSFARVSTGDVRFVLMKNGTGYYWNGAAWVSSNSTYAQANSAADVDENAESFTDAGIQFKLRAILHSADGQSTPVLTSATFTYDFYEPAPTSPGSCIVYGFMAGIIGEEISNIRIIVEHESSAWVGGYFFPQGSWDFYSDSLGYWEADLVQGLSLKFSIEYRDTLGKKRKWDLGTAAIPAQISVNFKDLFI